METFPSLLSIRDLAPVEDGGVIARVGFEFQDHIAVNFCLKMLFEPTISEVWCETQDDITIILNRSGIEVVEFVQVKGTQLQHFWSIPEICKGEKLENGDNKVRSSILEKSLGQERCQEPCCFRIVTALPVKDPLNVLCLPTDSPDRFGPNKSQKIEDVTLELDKRFPDLRSPKGNGPCFWVENTVWQVEYSIESIKNKNLPLLVKFVELAGFVLPVDIVERKIYPLILQKVHEAGLAKWAENPQKKKISRAQFQTWLREMVCEVANSSQTYAGKILQDKMERVQIPSDYIWSALEERRKFRSERLNPKYLEVNDCDLIEGEVLVSLSQLRIELDSGNCESGLPFLSKCIDHLKTLRDSLPSQKPPPLFYLTGYMYDVTDRCGHRYHREAV
jgi:hypothetical protein